MTVPSLSEHAQQDPRQAAYELKRRNFQASQGRIIKRMEGNGRGQGNKIRGDV